MTLYRLGYVAMSVNLQNASPSQTMTYKRFSQLRDEEAARNKLERIAKSNIENCLRLLKHNKAHDIHFFRLSSRLVPLATHEKLKGWDYLGPIKAELNELGSFAKENQMRIDFHPDHFVVINSPDKEIFKTSVAVLKYHYLLLQQMGIDPTHRCVFHLGGRYQDKEKSLERFIENWALVPRGIQKMGMIENDDTSYTLTDGLYVCEKLNIPLVFDMHHHYANHDGEKWEDHWGRVIGTWLKSPLPVKMHISSPKSQKEFKNHADFVNPNMILDFVEKTNGSVDQIDCMIEAKQKDDALFRLVDHFKQHPQVEMQDGSSFIWKG
ncbi:UV-damage endonuclease [Halobacillus karajensis]|uniref:UV DNA damage endonuclease n=1 Tax=Halobacillus karajensis TaxID=195088 RepID=A0A024P6F3_9BACI|nr:UV DNA damage repair endonuclease UvsE [Halobacillus karajensis]CDQ17795.1 UV DNA damage endonuclease [Halobacillus karajensis]CDQ24201.1 UV DNA damage endonuclease [Halobacillus karajensis]CDQ29550.1 UV DNA damage endonuclease [Halobacillus karajensis]SEH63710.1 UV-damage endonuclease [Halobacillus karajensis]